MKVEIIFNYLWSLAVWNPSSYLFTYMYKEKDWEEGNQNIRSC